MKLKKPLDESFYKKTTPQVLVLVTKNTRVLLGWKKRGVVKNCWVPAGGHVRKNECVERAAVRENRAEFGIEIDKLENIGVVDVYVEEDRSQTMITVFRAKHWSGEPRPDLKEFSAVRFFSQEILPSDQMLPGDREWLWLMLTSPFRTFVKLHCGKDRRDIKHVWMHLVAPTV